MASLIAARSTPRKLTIATRMAGDLRQRILDGDLEPGSKINLDEMRKDLDVSVSSVREAIGKLVSEGPVASEDRRGYRITPISLENLEEVTRLRAYLEGLALREAIRHADVDWEAEVMSALYRLNHTAREAGNVAAIEDWERAHRAFHMQLIMGCRMPQLLTFCEILHNQNDRYRRLFLLKSAGDRNVLAEHTAIAETAVAHDADQACALLGGHIERTGANLLARLRGNGFNLPDGESAAK